MLGWSMRNLSTELQDLRTLWEKGVKNPKNSDQSTPCATTASASNMFLGKKDNGESVVIDVNGVAVVSISSVLGYLQPIHFWEGSETV